MAGKEKSGAMDRHKEAMPVRTLAMIAMMAAVLCILGPLSIPIGIVPISLTNFGIYLTVYLLGWKKGTVSYLIYLMLGIAGLPVFSGFSGGIGKVLGPTGGYLVGFLFMPLIAGLVIQRYGQKKVSHYVLCFLGMAAGMAVCDAFGTIWFVQVFAGSDTPYTYSAALAACVWPFIPGDLAKAAAVAVIGPQLRGSLVRNGLLSD